MDCCVVLEEVILTCVSGYFEFSSDSHGAVHLFALDNALVYLLIVPFEIERIVVDAAESNLYLQLL